MDTGQNQKKEKGPILDVGRMMRALQSIKLPTLRPSQPRKRLGRRGYTKSLYTTKRFEKDKKRRKMAKISQRKNRQRGYVR